MGVLDVSGSEYYIQLKKTNPSPLKKTRRAPEAAANALVISWLFAKELRG